MAPVVPTRITQHTLWQALTGELPPMALPAIPLGRGVLDSRDVEPGDLFVALVGQNNDGHDYIAPALAAGANAVICEQRGLEPALQAGAVAVDCTQGRWSLRAKLPTAPRTQTPIAYIVDDAEVGLQHVGGFQRLHRTRPQLARDRHYGQRGQDEHQRADDCRAQPALPHALESGQPEQRAGPAADAAGAKPGSTNTLSWKWACMVWERLPGSANWPAPTSASITNVGPSHLSRLGSIERIQAAKSELPQALPGGRRRRCRHSQLGRRAGARHGRADAGPRLSLWA